MVGGVLVERTVKEVVPALVNNRDKVTGHFKYHKVYEKNAQLVTHVIPTDGQTDRKPGEAVDWEGRGDQRVHGEAPDPGDARSQFSRVGNTAGNSQVKNQEGGKKAPAQDDGAEKAGGVLVSKWGDALRREGETPLVRITFNYLARPSLPCYKLFSPARVIQDLSRTVRSSQDLLIVQLTLTKGKWTP